MVVVGAAVVVIGMVLTGMNWGNPVPVLGGILNFLLEVPFEPKAEPRGNILVSTLAITAAMNIATWATLASLLIGAAITAVAGFRRGQAAAT
jgi:hypothetical protein